ncbi:glucosidase II beta subunit-like-domain-containing protein [Crucibulum laeve]|uniref:Glucosidase 2 subunit beta n=1 Tax=Crucibulum laeve TaxID=68775 RepID=A0A5C3MCZ6_9AGAR|nr:glucosidase II beta subunit-like-domain-containing protein [Crucibulum laeve]
MIPWLLLLPLSSPVLVAAAAVDKTFGVGPDAIAKYTPLKSGNWKCLDGSKEIPWEFVNDDSCDCPDGSDEPGTGACPNTNFYCKNEGHIGLYIPSSRVKDGLCEVECCDGSDERPGVCPNLCKEIGEAYRKKRDEERKIQKTGSKIRSSYITFAHKEKKRLEASIETLTQEIEVKEKEVARLRDIAERTESLSQAALEHKQQSPLYKSLIDHSNALKSLRREHFKHLEREKALGDILTALRTGYNPNYQDMAVLEAVRGWEELAGLPHINDVGKDTTEETTAKEEEEAKEEEGEKEEPEEGMWDAGRLEHGLDVLLNTDYTSLLLEHEEHIQSPSEDSIIYDLTAYLPDSLIPQYEAVKETLVSWLRMLGVIRGEDNTAADSSRAHQALTDAETNLATMKNEKKTAEEDVAEIFDVEGFGAEGEWKKLDGLCLEKNTGDYTYEVCLFEEAKQKPNNGGTTFSLGRFDSWNPSPDVKAGSPEYYSKQVYKHGTRCWNGPERNVVLLLTCGTENALLTIQELEKCEYQFTGTTPALCLPLDGEKGNGNGKKDEL